MGLFAGIQGPQDEIDESSVNQAETLLENTGFDDLLTGEDPKYEIADGVSLSEEEVEEAEKAEAEALIETRWKLVKYVRDNGLEKANWVDIYPNAAALNLIWAIHETRFRDIDLKEQIMMAVAAITQLYNVSCNICMDQEENKTLGSEFLLFDSSKLSGIAKASEGSLLSKFRCFI